MRREKPTIPNTETVDLASAAVDAMEPDFHRRDLWQSIEDGGSPEWEPGMQIVEESNEHGFDFDLLGATKPIPEGLVPVPGQQAARRSRRPGAGAQDQAKGSHRQLHRRHCGASALQLRAGSAAVRKKRGSVDRAETEASAPSLFAP